MSEELVKAIAALRRGGWTHHDQIDGDEVMVDRTKDMARLADAIERLTAERAGWAKVAQSEIDTCNQALEKLAAAEARAEKLAEALKGEAIVALEAVAMDAVATGRGENTISDDVRGQVDAALVFCYAALQGEKQ